MLVFIKYLYIFVQVFVQFCKNSLLKLISIKLDVTYTDKQHYLIIKNGERAKKYQSELGESFDIEEGVILKTEFGKDFFKICCEWFLTFHLIHKSYYVQLHSMAFLYIQLEIHKMLSY